MKPASARKPATRRAGPRAAGAWLRQHRASLRDTGANLRVQSGSIVLGVLVIGVTLSLPVGLHVLQVNFLAMTQQLGAVPEVTLFLERSATRVMADGIAANLRLDDRIRRVRVIDKDSALAMLTADSALDAAARSLESNPLPYAIALEVDRATFEGASGSTLQAELATLPGVDDAVFDIDWMRKLEAGLAVIARVSAVIAAIIGTGVILITGNTIRSGIQNRREEIEVLKLCGATDAYVCRPFLYSGAIQGLAGASVGCLVVAIGVALVVPAVDQLALAYGNTVSLTNLSAPAVVATLAGGSFMGWVGALVAVTVYLKRLDSALTR